MNEPISRRPFGRLSTNQILIIIIFWFILPFVVLGKFSFIYIGDTFNFFVSHLISLSNNNIGSGLWNPVTSSGSDVRAIGVNGPVNRAMFSMFPGWLAYQFLIVVQTTGAILGSYLLCRRLFKLSEMASLLPGVIFGVMLPGLLNHSVFSLIPVLILSLSHLLDKPKSVLAWCLAIVTIIWMSGTAFISWLVPFPSGLIIGWFLFVERRRHIRDWVVIVGAAIVLQVLRYQDIQALLHVAPHAHISLSRSLPTIEDIFKWPSLLNNHINILSAGLFIFSWLATKNRSPLMRGLAVFLVIGLLAEPLALVIQIYVADFLPFIQGFNVTKIARMFEAVLWLSTAFAVKPILLWLKGVRGQRVIGWSITVSMFAVILFYGVSQKATQFQDWLTGGNYVHNLESPVIQKIASETKKSIIPSRAEIFQVYSTYLQPYGIETVGGYEPLYMRRYYEFWSTILEPWGTREPDRALMAISDKWPFFRTISLFLTTYTHQPERRFNDLYRLNLFSMTNVGWIFSRDKLTDPELQLVHGNVTPWSNLSRKEKIVTNLRANFFGREHLFVYKNLQVLPRFISPTQVKVLDGAQAVLKSMANSSVKELSRTLFIAKSDIPAGINPDIKYSKLKINPISYQSDEIELEVEAENEGLLEGFNAWSPFWTVEIDGKPGQIFPANHAFWGVKIPKGRHRVIFRYRRNRA